MAKYINSWLENFERQAMLRRGLVLNGNVIDLAFDRYNKLQPVNQVLRESLTALGFKHVINYSQVSGLSGISGDEWNDLLSSSMRSTDEVQGDAYDMGDDDFDSNSSSTEASGVVPLDPNQFFAAAKRIMVSGDTPVAFVVDWSNFMFGQMNALSDRERAWLDEIVTGLRDAKVSDTVEGFKQPQSLIIFVCQEQSTIPPIIYLNNPLFAQLTIALPNIDERKAAILARSYQFNLSDNLYDGSADLNAFVTLTDGLKLRDIDNLTRLSRQVSEPSSAKNIVSLYRYGKKDSPWEKLDHQRLKETKTTLGRRVKGQEQAIEAVNKILIRAFTGLSGLQHSAKARTPKGALFFVGPTGVGKTELAKSLAEFVFGDEDACIRFDMSEFNHEHADQRLVGAPPGYVGYEEGGQLTNAIKAKPFSLILFDEIEKAHPRILDKFLQILEDGRLTDGKGETVSFSDTFIVFTSNIGASDIEPSDDKQAIARQFIDAVSNHFKNELNRPELLGRIGSANIIPFNFMRDPEVLKTIAKAKLKPIEDRLKEKWGIKNISFSNEDRSLNALINQVNQREGGRGVLNVMTQYLLDPLADFIFSQADNASRFRGRTIVISNARETFDFDIE